MPTYGARGLVVETVVSKKLVWPSTWITKRWLGRTKTLGEEKELTSLQRANNIQNCKSNCGGAGIWTQDFPHAKRALYHWVTPPMPSYWYRIQVYMWVRLPQIGCLPNKFTDKSVCSTSYCQRMFLQWKDLNTFCCDFSGSQRGLHTIFTFLLNAKKYYEQVLLISKKDVLEELGFEPRSFRLRGRHSTAELHPRPSNVWGKYEDYFWVGLHEVFAQSTDR